MKSKENSQKDLKKKANLEAEESKLVTAYKIRKTNRPSPKADEEFIANYAEPGKRRHDSDQTVLDRQKQLHQQRQQSSYEDSSEDLSSVQNNDDLPDLPWDSSSLQPKPLLEKSSSKVKSRNLRDIIAENKSLRIIIAILIIVVLIFIIGFLFLNKLWLRQLDPPTYSELTFPTLSKDSFAILSGQDSLYERIIKEFSQDAKGRGPALHKLKLDFEDPSDVSTPIIFRRLPDENPIFEDQIAKLKILVAGNDKSSFKAGLKEIKETFSAYLGDNPAEETWSTQLSYLRVLLLARQYWYEEDIDAEIREYQAKLLNVFESGPPAQARQDFEDQLYPMVSSNEKEVYDPDNELSFIYLDSIDLWVLKALIEYDPSWQGIFDQWKEIIQKGRLENGFYAFAWDTENNSYIPSDQYTFRSNTVSSLRQITSLFEIGEGRPDDLLIFNQLLIRDAGLYKYYHTASQAAMTDEKSTEAVLLLKRLGLISNQVVSLELANEQIDTWIYRGTAQDGLDFIYQLEEDDYFFYFRDNVYRILYEALEEFK